MCTLRVYVADRKGGTTRKVQTARFHVTGGVPKPTFLPRLAQSARLTGKPLPYAQQDHSVPCVTQPLPSRYAGRCADG